MKLKVYFFLGLLYSYELFNLETNCCKEHLNKINITFINNGKRKTGVLDIMILKDKYFGLSLSPNIHIVKF